MAILQSLEPYEAVKVNTAGDSSGTTEVHAGSVRIATFWPGAEQEAHIRLFLAAPLLLEACKAALCLAGDDDFPDNGEYSGAAITDLIRVAVEEAQEGLA